MGKIRRNLIKTSSGRELVVVSRKPQSKGRRKLAYSAEFKEFIRQNPRIMEKVRLVLEEAGKTPNKPVFFMLGKEKGEATLFDETREAEKLVSQHFLVKFKGRSFFVKKIDNKGLRFRKYLYGVHPSASAVVSPYQEFRNMAELEELEKELDFEVVKFHLGINLGKNSYFVSDFYNLIRLDKLRKNISQMSGEEYR
ncbi:MAG: hypothetical protein Q7K42_00930, partial [Candidatus Diapherotrites archaeon]|nr:hypothetical protein [Candidatus Diapherotrites archaeon]